MFFRSKSVPNAIEKCPVCDGRKFVQHDVLWPALIEQWELDPNEVVVINRQQGLYCKGCRNNLRSMGLAAAIMNFYSFNGLFREFVASDSARSLKVLEVNESGTLHELLTLMPGLQLGEFPDIDMQNLPHEDESFDLVLHSDSLEHIADPVKGLSECRRVLRRNAACIFTIPLVPGRPTRRRANRPKSYHGSNTNPEDCLVHSEYGSDFWIDVATAGFSECRMYMFESPASVPIIAVR